jgi:hypothetical protein
LKSRLTGTCSGPTRCQLLVLVVTDVQPSAWIVCTITLLPLAVIFALAVPSG